MKHDVDRLPAIIAGPLLRRVDKDSVTLWLVTSTNRPIQAVLSHADKVIATLCCSENDPACIQIGQQAWVHLITFIPPDGVPEGVWLNYDLGIPHESDAGEITQWLKDLLPGICYPGEDKPRFVWKPQLDTILHGSCRKPHHRGKDGFVAADQLLQQVRRTNEYSSADVTTGHTSSVESNSINDIHQQPSLLILHGDQVYVDDVAGPMLLAIKQIVQLLGLRDETIAGCAEITLGSELLNGSSHVYERLELLPDDPVNTTLIETVFQGAKKPIFTSANADNHLITLAEVLAMYLLVWSPQLWKFVSIDPPEGLSIEHYQRYLQEAGCINQFIHSLPIAQRVLANVPVYMIFDDHDITDDWNLSEAWKQRAYEHPFSRRIIGNAIVAYLICQGWGNNPKAYNNDLIKKVQDSLVEEEPQAHDSLISDLLNFKQWGYVLDTHPPLIALDARTRRWASSVHPVLPSGLLDEEGLAELEDHLLGKQAVILISSAPIFGVKLIEVIQRIFAWCGMALVVDAENWMSHKGSAKGVLEIFQHPETPRTFVILSGDVHYSFAYDVRLRRPWRKLLKNESPKQPASKSPINRLSRPIANIKAQRKAMTDDLERSSNNLSTSPHIWQITSSGIKNRFPAALLRIFDRTNRWLYAGYSPLNLLTRRRRMHIRPRRPSEHQGRYRHQRLVNATGIGILKLDKEGQPIHISVKTSKGAEIVFADGYSSDWH